MRARPPRRVSCAAPAPSDPFTPHPGGFTPTAPVWWKDVTIIGLKRVIIFVIRTVGVIPPDVIANPVYDVDSSTFSTTPLSLLLPGEVVRWGGAFYHACPRCWGVFSLPNHDINVTDVGVIAVEPPIVCPDCGLHCKYEEGRVITDRYDDGDPEDDDWRTVKRERAEFVYEHRPNGVERLLSQNYPNVREWIRSDGGS